MYEIIIISQTKSFFVVEILKYKRNIVFKFQIDIFTSTVTDFLLNLQVIAIPRDMLDLA